MRVLRLLWLKARVAYLEGLADHHQIMAAEAEDAVARHAARWNELFDELRSVRASISMLERPSVMLRQALRGSRVRS